MEEILIIDDSPEFSSLLAQNLLPYHGYKTAVAQTGWEGLAAIRLRNPDLILLDLQLPDTTGLDLLRQLGEQGLDIPVILMTAHGSEQTAVEAFRLGARNYLIKPFSQDDAITAIERALRERRLQREKEQLHQHLQQRVRELTILSAIGKSVTSLLAIEEVLERIVEAGVYLTRAEEGFLLLADAESKELYLRAAKNVGEDRVRHFRIPIDDSIAGQVFRSGEPIRLDKASAGRELKIKSGFLVYALLQVPLIVGGRTIGVLGVVNREIKHSFSENHQYLLAALADYAAIALENARLFQQVSTSEESYRDLFESANDLIFTLDRQLCFVTINQRVLALTGYEQEELVGQPLERISEPEQWPSATACLAPLLQQQVESGSCKLVLVRKDGEQRYTEVNARTIAQEGQSGYIHCIARDVTERRRLESQLLQAEKLSAIGQLVAGVAHELNNPLTSVNGFTELLLRRKDLDESAVSDLRHISLQAQRAARIVQNLLTFARKQHHQRVATDINTVVENTLMLHDYHLRVDNIRVVRELAQSLPPVVADPDQLQQVLLNLINNASQSMAAKKGGTLTVRTSVIEGGEILVEVHDTGVGITPESLNRIFDPFYTTKPVGQGTGLGLSICYGIVSEHGGRIWAESQPDKGSSFFVALPAGSTKPEQPAEAEVEAAPEQPQPMPALNVLVVDDEEGVSELLNRLLGQLGHTVSIVTSGEDALKLLDQQQYDLILTDVKMPGMSGFELHQHIKSYSEALARRVIFVTGDTLSPATQTLLAQIGNPAIAKPFTVELFETLLAQIIPLELEATPAPAATATPEAAG